MSTGTTRPSDSKQAPAPNKNPLKQECNEVREDFQTLVEDVGTSINTYCQKRPQMAGLMIFAIGVYVGWKIKPW